MASVIVTFIDGHLPTEQIVLPRRSEQLGTFEGLDEQPTSIWPITLLCIQHGHVFERSLDTVQYGPVAGPGRRTNPTPIWVIDCECAQGNCRGKSRVFAFGDEPQTDNQIRMRLLQANHVFSCQGHPFVLDAGRMTVERVKEEDY